MNVVWFKRDLRVSDHAPLTSATQSGPTLALYILEPLLWREKDLSARHYAFLQQSLLDLQSQLKKLNFRLIIRIGQAEDVFTKLHQNLKIKAVFSHQETWNDWTYQRDKRVSKLFKTLSIPWHEFQHNGVVRKLASRDGWAKQWHHYMTASSIALPARKYGLDTSIDSDNLPSPNKLNLSDDLCKSPQVGGRHFGLALLDSFFETRGKFYTKEMSSPVTAYESCSRLSTYLAFGSISVREIYQLAQARKVAIYEQTPPGSPWRSSARSFLSRLRWHCHFIQKLEDEPTIELKNLHPAIDGLREGQFNDAHFEAWKEGRTGYPFIDACMRALRATGWINFRMRAMLVSFSSNHLWLHWREPSLHLARLFLDYEPGIHYSQVQMQSGATGINAIRIYNPIKQSIDQDLKGVFIKKWVPELASLSTADIHTPWLAQNPPKNYPTPIVDEITARREANERLYSIRRSKNFQNLSSKIVKKHASRKKPFKTSKNKNEPSNVTGVQRELF
ncbi:MAG: deoxyribodipyrimidine photo-lyase [Proteobacteria bacterium]|nr:deoxyribodipyrimidine photo-lyase [Pseudomonadota bacterium]MDA1012534.1 deoxyribodipyrimidine photo-lyase [Pseudomonadota bacterium]